MARLMASCAGLSSLLLLAAAATRPAAGERVFSGNTGRWLEGTEP